MKTYFQTHFYYIKILNKLFAVYSNDYDEIIHRYMYSII